MSSDIYGLAIERVIKDAKNDAVTRKDEKIGMLKALIEEYEKRGDYEHVKELTRKLRVAQSQKRAMKP